MTDVTVAPQGPNVAGNPALRALVIAQTTDFEIPTSGGEFNIFNVYTLKVPAGAVCDPSATDTQQGYAAGAWDSACTPASGSITVHATAKWANGVLYVDFQPALRFVPGAVVTLASDVVASTIQSNASTGNTEAFAIQYSPAIGAAGVPDAIADPSVRTQVNGNTGQLIRRIKHFSGYQIIISGEPCDPNLGNPLCVWVDDDGFGH